jgi:hypothetical protein
MKFLKEYWLMILMALIGIFMAIARITYQN